MLDRLHIGVDLLHWLLEFGCSDALEVACMRPRATPRKREAGRPWEFRASSSGETSDIASSASLTVCIRSATLGGLAQEAGAVVRPFFTRNLGILQLGLHSARLRSLKFAKCQRFDGVVQSAARRALAPRHSGGNDPGASRRTLNRPEGRRILLLGIDEPSQR
jgi:hypothetical protein